jgi:hypothetical protein
MDHLTLEEDTLLTRDMVASALSKAGYPVKPRTLATRASRGGGPPFRLFGRRPLYRWRDALDWARGRLGPPLRSTSEKDAYSAIGAETAVGKRGAESLKDGGAE